MARVPDAESILLPLAAQDREEAVYVIYTNFEGTRRALCAAARLVRGLGIRLVLLAAQLVPFPLPLEEPPVASEFTRRRMADLAVEADAEVRVLLCRDRGETLRRVLPPGALVLYAAPRRWWWGWERTLRRQLRREGHQVIWK